MWGDGNDLADLAGPALDDANHRGQLRTDWYFKQVETYDPMLLATTSIEVRVR